MCLLLVEAHLFALMCACLQANAGMTTLFVRSLQRLPSLQATVISNAANMAATVRSRACTASKAGMLLPTVRWLSYISVHSSWRQLHTTQAVTAILGQFVLCSTTASADMVPATGSTFAYAFVQAHTDRMYCCCLTCRRAYWGTCCLPSTSPPVGPWALPSSFLACC
jgi:hypothetical protein